MEDPMTIEEAIRISLQYEAKVRRVYEDAVNEADDPVAKKVFRVLAQEEQEHLDYLKERLDELKQTGKATPDPLLPTAIPSREAIAAGVKNLEDKVAAKRSERELDLFRAALEVETETSNFYKRMVQELGPEGKAFFSRFVEIEEGHVSIVQAEIDSLTGSGYWFDFREFDLSPSG
jgi:rubrerythrin